MADDGVLTPKTPPDLRVEGYASLFNVVDLARDVILPGAFGSSLAARGTQGIRMLWRHDNAAPIGLWTALVEDEVGLRATGIISAGFPTAAAIRPEIAHGRLDGLSIGFRPVAWRRRPDGIRELTVIELEEISLVAFPMLPRARLSITQAL
jgi:uncharacterized protein